jgi:predicted phosphodiesterase
MRIAVVSDIHSNLAALDAVLGAIGSVDAIWHLGDVVGYGPQPVEVVERLRHAGAVGVRGNHDDAAAGGTSIELFNPDGHRAMDWTRARIDERVRSYLAGLPERRVPEGSGFTLVHGSPLDPIWEYVDSPGVAQANLAAFDTPYCLIGHTHVPLVFRESKGRMRMIVVDAGARLALDDRRLILNPGSVGQPRDGDPRAGYLVVDTDAAAVTWTRIEYDVAATKAAMSAAGLPGSLARRLDFGL